MTQEQRTDSVSRAEFFAVQQQAEDFERRLRALEQRLALWAANGLAVADAGSIFAGYSGAYGTSALIKRSDGT